MRVLKRSFFLKATPYVARKLLGKIIIRKLNGRKYSGRIVETEAYLGENDPASHASRGRTPRNSVMFGKPGVAYVYFCYGAHYLMNIVTEKEGRAGAVLLRGLEPIKSININTDGPGKLTKGLKIDKELNGFDLTTGKKFYVCDDGFKDFKCGKSGRIGISKGKEKLFRYYIKGNKFVSKKTV